MDEAKHGLREEILGIMSEHGIDPAAMSAEHINAAAMPAMQQQILDAISQHGVEVPDAGFGGGGD